MTTNHEHLLRVEELEFQLKMEKQKSQHTKKAESLCVKMLHKEIEVQMTGITELENKNSNLENKCVKMAKMLDSCKEETLPMKEQLLYKVQDDMPGIKLLVESGISPKQLNPNPNPVFL